MVNSDTLVPKEGWFSQNEYQRRLTAVRAALDERNLRGAVFFSPENACYLTGHHSIDSWEFRAMIITQEQDPVLLLYSFERGRFLASSWLKEACFHGPGADPMASLAKLIADLGLGGEPLGVEQSRSQLNLAEWQRLKETLGAVCWIPVDGLVERVRLRKSSEELQCIRQAARFTLAGMQAAGRLIREGVFDHEIAAAAVHEMLRQGSDNFVMMPTVAVGYRSGLSHSAHGHIAVRPGDAVFVELSGCCRHYSAPLMFTTTLGSPPSEWKELFDVAHETAETIIRVARPGVPACEVAQAALRVIQPIEQRIEFHYNFGYSLGISFPPHWLEDSHFYLKTNNPSPLESGMVFHAPLTMRVLGKYAAGTSCTFVITEQGSEVLTSGAGE